MPQQQPIKMAASISAHRRVVLHVSKRNATGLFGFCESFWSGVLCLQDFCESFWSGVSVSKISARAFGFLAFGLACLSPRFLRELLVWRACLARFLRELLVWRVCLQDFCEPSPRRFATPLSLPLPLFAFCTPALYKSNRLRYKGQDIKKQTRSVRPSGQTSIETSP